MIRPDALDLRARMDAGFTLAILDLAQDASFRDQRAQQPCDMHSLRSQPHPCGTGIDWVGGTIPGQARCSNQRERDPCITGRVTDGAIAFMFRSTPGLAGGLADHGGSHKCAEGIHVAQVSLSLALAGTQHPAPHR
jgi:hypothetical protein